MNQDANIRVAAASARLGDTSGKFALLPDEGGAWLFPRAMGYDRALLMVLLSEIYSAEEALRLGLVTEVVPDDRLKNALGNWPSASPRARRWRHASPSS